MNQGIRVFLPLVDRGRCLSTMRVCSVILGQPLYIGRQDRKANHFNEKPSLLFLNRVEYGIFHLEKRKKVRRHKIVFSAPSDKIEYYATESKVNCLNKEARSLFFS